MGWDSYQELLTLSEQTHKIPICDLIFSITKGYIYNKEEEQKSKGRVIFSHIGSSYYQKDRIGPKT